MPEEFRNNISVVVVNYDRIETTVKCVDCIEHSQGDYVREVIVVDNGSSPAVLAELTELLAGKARIVSLGTNRYFGEGNNIGVEDATGDFILLLNNDAYVEPDCIPELVQTMEKDPSIAAVGPMFLYPSGAVQEVGAIVLETGDIVQVGKGAIWGPDHYTTECSVDYCSAACLLMRKRDFLDVGGFSLQWEPAYYEDADLCLSLRQAVGPVLVNPRARVVHVESLTTADVRMRLESQVDINRLAFVDKWGECLKARQAAWGPGPAKDPTIRGPGPEAVDAPERAAIPRRAPHSRIGTAVLYSPYELVPGGGERYMFELAATLADAIGPDNVRMASPHRYSGLRMRQMSDAFGVRGPTAAITLDELRESPPDMTVVLGNEIAPPAPGYGRLYNVYMCQFPFDAPEAYIRSNGPFINTFDEIWVNSDFTRRYVNGNLRLFGLRAPKIRIVPPPSTISRPDHIPDWHLRSAVMTVGRFFQGGHNKRQDVVIEIVRELNKTLGRSVPLVMAGSLHATHASRDRFQELLKLADGIECHLYPNVRRDRLIDLYLTSAVLVHAAGYEVDKFAFPERLEHFGIVPVEAASVGCIPVVYGAGGPAEVMATLGCPTTFGSIPEAVDRIAGLFDHPDRSDELSRDLIIKSDCFSQRAFRERVGEALSGLL